MGHVQDRIIECVAAEVGGGFWEEAPGLYFLNLSRDGPSLKRLDIPDRVWDSMPPAAVLCMLAGRVAVLADMARAIAPRGLHGFAFRATAYGLFSDEGTDPGLIDSYDEAAREERLHEHPDAVRLMMMYAVDRAGITYLATRRADTGEVERHVSYPHPGNPCGGAGLIPEALEALVSATLGTRMPPRPEAMS